MLQSMGLQTVRRDLATEQQNNNTQGVFILLTCPWAWAECAQASRESPQSLKSWLSAPKVERSMETCYSARNRVNPHRPVTPEQRHLTITHVKA